MAYGLKSGLLQSKIQTGANWSTDVAGEAGGLYAAPRCDIETADFSHFTFAPVAFRDWSRTGAKWGSDRPGAPVPSYPLKGVNWSTSGAALRFDSWTGAGLFRSNTPTLQPEEMMNA